MVIFFVILQILLLMFMMLHDWISVPPLNDIGALSADKFHHRIIFTIINSSSVLIPLIITLVNIQQHDYTFSSWITIIAFYFFLSVGTILSWWVPYLLGSSKKHKIRFQKFKNTHHFLPSIKDNVIPNTLHVMLHLQIWLCMVLAFYIPISS